MKDRRRLLRAIRGSARDPTARRPDDGHRSDEAEDHEGAGALASRLSNRLVEDEGPVRRRLLDQRFVACPGFPRRSRRPRLLLTDGGDSSVEAGNGCDLAAMRDYTTSSLSRTTCCSKRNHICVATWRRRASRASRRRRFVSTPTCGSHVKAALGQQSNCLRRIPRRSGAS